MTTVVLLLALGIVLLALEVFLPGGLVGTIGVLALVAGCVVAFNQFGPEWGAVTTLAAVLCLGLAIYIEFVLLPKSRVGRRFFLRSAIDAATQPLPADPAAVVGHDAEALTMLAPSGYVLLDGRRVEARSQSGLIPKGARVRVVAVDNFSVIVTTS